MKITQYEYNIASNRYKQFLRDGNFIEYHNVLLSKQVKMKVSKPYADNSQEPEQMWWNVDDKSGAVVRHLASPYYKAFIRIYQEQGILPK